MKREYTPEFIDALTRKLEELGCAQVHDAAARFVTVLERPFVARSQHACLAGPVFTVNTDNDMLPLLQGLDACPAGWILYARNTAAESEALAGDILATAAVAKGIRGLVVDGAVRDIRFFHEVNLPVFSTEVRYVSAKTARVPARDVPERVTYPKATLEPGDLLLVDPDGALAIPSARVDAVLAGAYALREVEERLKAELRAKKPFAELTGLHDFLAGRGPLKFEV